ncbi:DOMON domain-containing protein [Mycena sanguinolenta]|uniref:DOMON domain-containing protein n=1 Tax=Mycena sanguinolenta TaxID=230812 RepID=A0A8H6ZEQ0_9AGAR|nr:DOMON domain-containing protein [Mycena sanguinolenta]
MWSFTLAFMAILVGCSAMPSTPGNLTLERRTTINDGTAFVQGTIGNMTWQASGVLESGCTLSTITDCYHMYLTSDPSEQLDSKHLDSPRQRDEFHFPQVSAGTEFAYSWKQYLYSSTGTGSTWFHIMQAFGVSENNPLVTLDAVSGTLRIKDYVRGTGGPSCGSIACPTTDLANYHGTTTTHHISGKFGPSGSLSYTITNDTGSTILSYNVTGAMGAGAGYIKFGMYRITFDGMTTANAVVGDWSG